MEPTNKHSQNSIAMKNEGYKLFGHVPEVLSSKLFTLRKEWKVYRVNVTSGEKHKAPDGALLCGDIEMH